MSKKRQLKTMNRRVKIKDDRKTVHSPPKTQNISHQFGGIIKWYNKTLRPL